MGDWYQVLPAVRDRLLSHPQTSGLVTDANIRIVAEPEAFQGLDLTNFQVSAGAPTHVGNGLSRGTVRVDCFVRLFVDQAGDQTVTITDEERGVLSALRRVRIALHHSYLGGVLDEALRWQTQSKPVAGQVEGSDEYLVTGYAEFTCGVIDADLPHQATGDNGSGVDRG